MVEERSRWESLARADAQAECFEESWKPQSWKRKARFVFVKTLKARQSKAPLQLDLFEPREFGYEHKVVVTNKRGSVQSVARFHQGRGQQENLFSELKSEGTLAYAPARKWNANKTYMLAGILAHNLSRELQMERWERLRGTTQKRSPLWLFERIDTIRKTLILRAGRLTHPQGRATLTLSRNKTYAQQLLNYLAI
jgi:hypothetical protein